MTAINDKYVALGGPESFLGNAVTEERVAPDGVGRYRHYQGGSIYWSPTTGAHEVHGAIRGKWSALGWERSFLGYPMTDETATPDGQGRFNHFQGGSIYWHPTVGAHEVHGAIRGKWASLGWERSLLGYPITDETATPAPNPTGRYNHFQRGSIYWHPSTGAFEVHGDIRARWASLGWERSFLRFPVTDELTTPDREGRFNHFQGGSIYWHPSIGSHEVHGAIRDLWAMNGWEAGRLGYPLTNETPMNPQDSGRFSRFQNGTIGWTPDMATWVDYHGGDPEGRFEGSVQLFRDSNYSGSNRSYQLTSERCVVFHQTLAADGLHDRVSSLRLNLPRHCSLYLFEHRDYRGRYTRVNGSGSSPVQVPALGSHLNDRLSSAVAVNHGLVSVIVGADDLQTAAADALDGFNVSGVRWNGPPQISIEPRRRLRVRLRGTIEETWPDSYLDLEVYFRLYVTGPTTVVSGWGGWHANFGGSFAGYANSTISQMLHSFLDDRNRQRSLEAALNAAFADRLSALGSVPASLRASINLRRLNFLPEGLEVVISDNDTEAGLISTVVGEGVSTDRVAGQITTGSV